MKMIMIIIIIIIILAARPVILFMPEGAKRATSASVELPCLRKDLRTGSISRDIVNVPSELGRRRSGTFAEVARLVPPDAADMSAPDTLRGAEVPACLSRDCFKIQWLCCQ